MYSALKFAVAILALGAATSTTAAPSRKPSPFWHQSVVRCPIKSKEVAARVADLPLDVWTHEMTVGSHADIRIRDDKDGKLVESIFGKCDIWIKDIQALVNKEAQPSKARLAPGDLPDTYHDSYHPVTEIVGKLEEWSTKYANLAKFVPSIGKTTEGRDIPAIHITSSSSNSTTADAGKKKIWFNGGIHAREWISSATVMYIMDSLLSSYGTDATLTKLLDSVEFVVTPMCNPDGYEYSRSNDRMWRKNRAKNGGSSYGVDLNRNFPFKWGGSGSSGSTGSETYRGPSAGSEPETKAMIKYITGQNISAGIDFHSYSQLVLRSWGYTETKSPREAELKRIGDGIAGAIKTQSGKRYRSISSSELYIADGLVSDWIDGALNGLGYTIELRPEQTWGGYGFVLPPDQIRPVGKEQLAAITYFANQVLATKKN